MATGFISVIDINLLASYHECRSLIGYAAHYLFCCVQRVAWQCVVNKMAAVSLRFRSVSEGDKFNDWTADFEKNWKLRRTNVSDKSPQSIQIIRLKSLITVRFNNLRMLVVALQDKAQFCCKLVSISCKVTTM